MGNSFFDDAFYRGSDPDEIPGMIFYQDLPDGPAFQEVEERILDLGFNWIGTVTGRMSSSKPNLQNTPTPGGTACSQPTSSPASRTP
jgi:hypothetical protein